MAGSEVVVKGVRALYLSTAVDFEGGYIAVFDNHPHGVRDQITGLKSFVLMRDGLVLVRYDGVLRPSGANDNGHRFTRLDKPFTPELVAEYWEAAVTYVRDEARKSGHPPNYELELRRMYVEEGNPDLDRIKQGLALHP